MGQMYKYINHQSPTPYTHPSIRRNTGTTNTTFLPKKRVNMMNKKLTSSIFAAQASAILQTSITATIIPIKVISFMAKLVFFDFMLSLLSFMF
jgi:hypothetical protein